MAPRSSAAPARDTKYSGLTHAGMWLITAPLRRTQALRSGKYVALVRVPARHRASSPKPKPSTRVNPYAQVKKAIIKDAKAKKKASLALFFRGAEFQFVTGTCLRMYGFSTALEEGREAYE